MCHYQCVHKHPCSVCLRGNKAEITNLVNLFVFLHVSVCLFIISRSFLGPLELHLVCGDFMLDLAQSCMVAWN